MTSTDATAALDDTQAPAARSSRRRLLGRASALGAAVVGAIAGTWLDEPAASAAPGCCDLRYPNGPWCGGTKGVDGTDWSCPHGYSKRYWSCHTQYFYYTCWECTTGSTCWQGSWKCSNYFVVYVP